MSEQDEEQPLSLSEEIKADRVAWVLTLLVSAVSPNIDKHEAYEILRQASIEGLSEDTAVIYGQLIRMSGPGPGTMQ